MDILKKSLAPITEKGWKEITSRVGEIMATYSTARKFVDLNGPNGLEFGAVTTGRLQVPKDQDSEKVQYGIREVLPLVEIRKPFELDIWELDNIDRGARDIDLTPLEKAAKELAIFEEDAIYKGFTPANIIGMEKSSSQDIATLPQDPNEFLKAIGRQVNNLNKKSVGGPYSLVINAEQWVNLLNYSDGYPVLKQLKAILGGKVLVSQSNASSFLVSERGGDYELAIGQDICCGFDSATSTKVKLYLSSSFTFRVLTPEAIIVFK